MHVCTAAASPGGGRELELGGSASGIAPTVAQVLRPQQHGPAAFGALGELLRAGGLVAFPTETVYGLGANGLDAAAVLKIFEAKGRPLNDPCILHVPGVAEGLALLELSGLERAVFEALAESCWPGPLSIVGRAGPSVPRVVTAQTDFVAVRCPAHPAALELLREARVPLAAPSANRFGHISPTCAEHVLDDLGHIQGLHILDGGPCGVGIESTVVKLDLEQHRVVVLRKGGASRERLQAALAKGSAAGLFGGVEVAIEYHDTRKAAEQEVEGSKALEAPGMMLRHYAPSVPTFLLCEADEANAAIAGFVAQEPARCVLVDFDGRLRRHQALFLKVFDLCDDPGIAGCGPGEGGDEDSVAQKACRHVFAVLRAAEAFALATGAKLICLADFAPDVHGSYAEALHDRLFRAASGRRLLLALGAGGPQLVAL